MLNIYLGLSNVELKHEIELWRRAAARVSVVSREESIMKALFQQKAVQRENALIKQLYRMRLNQTSWS